MANLKTPKGLVIAAPGSGSGKTIFSLGLVAALRASGVRVKAAKTGPDYIDTSYLSHAAGRKAINLDPWGMQTDRLQSIAASHVRGEEFLLIEGVMGLFDGAANGEGSTADLALVLGLPILLVVDAARQSQSISALVFGFANWRPGVNIIGIILNNVASVRHEHLLRDALACLDIPVLGVLARDKNLNLPSRHLGLVLADEISKITGFVNRGGALVAQQCDVEKIAALSAPVQDAKPASRLPPLGQHIAIARDGAFAFIYQHWLDDWRAAGAELSFFSPLANEAPCLTADAVFLPGGYPELHGDVLANAHQFFAGLKTARDRGALIYGECGGYMVLGEWLVDKAGARHKMSGLLPHTSSIDQPRRVLGYRQLAHASNLPWPKQLRGHEFHYSSSSEIDLPPLFAARDANGKQLVAMGAIADNVIGSYAHVIDRAPERKSK